MSAKVYDSAQARRSAVRVPLDTGDSLIGKMMSWYSRRTYGDVLDNGLAMLHNRPVLWSVLRFEKGVAKWKRLDPDLKTLAQMAAAAMIGCSWCMDFGYFAAHSAGLDTSKLEEVPRWRDSDVFTAQERRVLEYTEAVTSTPPTVTDEMAESLRSELGNDAFVELTMMIAVENERSRFNSALGLTSQGFKEHCELRR
ncbi:carboxymuconolactone decarboxylase family protein [Nocardioides terrisoli]|uniref:carboxymuconolactone decarboxylase family protein n=1 Tax=Nocardioides terrisoli TaxID=3388267 RepID=UPI00287B85A6|nr:carboxymuconolactone decarboxylase family protein [Nocardioides marmorisolisilvae]